ncbi:MAG: Flp pilus assembly protein CpaB [Acidobacteria bacterium]|nr:Flp pilus assembly protein CpaB [Acidobacteriota bacterium]
MNKRFLGVIVFAVCISLAASLVVYKLIVNQIATGPKSQHQALVAVRDMPTGYLVKDGDFIVAPWGGPIPTGAITKPEEAVGRGALIPTQSGELLLNSHFAAKGAGAGLAVTIPAGKRAMAVKVNDVVGVAGFVLPGMRVDVIACGTPPTKEKETLGSQARTLLQNIEVLSAGQNIQREPDGKPVTVQVVNLLVTPAEAETLSLAGNETKLQLVLRNPLDEETVKTPGTSTAYLFAGRPTGMPVSTPPAVRAAMVKPVPVKPRMEKVLMPINMEIISGAKRENVKVGQYETEQAAKEGRP